MQDLINAYFALSEQEREYFILAIAPSLCRTFQKNPDSIPRFCRALNREEQKVSVSIQLESEPFEDQQKVPESEDPHEPN